MKKKGMGQTRPRSGPDPWIKVALSQLEGSTRVQKEKLVHVPNSRNIIHYWLRDN